MSERSDRHGNRALIAISLTGVAIFAIVPWLVTIDALGVTFAVLGSAGMGALLAQEVPR